MRLPEPVLSAADEYEFLNYLGQMEDLEEDHYRGAEVINAYADGRIVASLVYGPYEGKTHVYHVYIRPEYRRQGLLERFVEAVAHDAQIFGRAIDGDFVDERLRERFNG